MILTVTTFTQMIGCLTGVNRLLDCFIFGFKIPKTSLFKIKGISKRLFTSQKKRSSSTITAGDPCSSYSISELMYAEFDRK